LFFSEPTINVSQWTVQIVAAYGFLIMGKNIALFIDGTGNNGPRDEPSGTNTNVHKLYLACDDVKDYQEGVANNRFDILGGLIGFGTKERLQAAYNFLIGNYRKDDNIFLFGFSRGALAVRVFAAFLGNVGTLFGKPPFDIYLPYMYRLFESAVILDVVGHWKDYLGQFGERPRPLPIHFLGVWDTVEEYHPRCHYPEIEFLAPHITHARQAAAIHERRVEMEPTFWKQWGDEQTVKQMWFPGAHADVGGGYVDSAFSDAALKWMCDEAIESTLNVNTLTAMDGRLIIHQQKTDIPVIGRNPFAKEQVRQELTPTEQRLFESMDMSGTARTYLHGKLMAPVQYENYPDGVPTEALAQMNTADDRARKLLSRIDSQTKPPRVSID
jgi:hypothetical protein